MSSSLQRLSMKSLAHAVLALTLGLFFFAPFWGRLADRKGCRPVIVLGLAGFAVTLAVFALADNFIVMERGEAVISGGRGDLANPAIRKYLVV